jgi:hypothetical protein
MFIIITEGHHMRPNPGWKDNINMNHRAIRWEDVKWIHLLQDRDNWWLLKTR